MPTAAHTSGPIITSFWSSDFNPCVVFHPQHMLHSDQCYQSLTPHTKLPMFVLFMHPSMKDFSFETHLSHFPLQWLTLIFYIRCIIIMDVKVSTLTCSDFCFSTSDLSTKYNFESALATVTCIFLGSYPSSANCPSMNCLNIVLLLFLQMKIATSLLVISTE